MSSTEPATDSPDSSGSPESAIGPSAGADATESTPEIPEAAESPLERDDVEGSSLEADDSTAVADDPATAGDAAEAPELPDVDEDESDAAGSSLEEAEAPEPEPEPAAEPEPTEPEPEPEPEPAAEPEPEPAAEPEPEESADEPAPVAATPATPVPMPRPAPRPAPRPGRPGSSAPAKPAEPWGRVDDGGTVFVREGDSWREVGQFPDGDPQEALAYFERKFQDLAAKVRLLEQRKNAGASASDLGSAAAHLREEVSGAAAVGDLAALEARIDALNESLSAATETEAAAAREAVDAAIAERTSLVEKAEALAARDPRTTQWKQASTELATLFEAWQSQQQNGPRLPKSISQVLWKRFRDARSTVERHRREFYAELDETHKAARDRKTALVEKAEALIPKGEDGITAYRGLLDEWKGVGRAGKKVDDALWARFKAAGDAIYGARVERDAAEQAESQPRIEAKRSLLAEAAAVADEADIVKARGILSGIQRRWDEVGRISPRERERALDDELRKIETALRAREDVDWKRNNPETKARAGEMSRQLNEAIEKLETELAKAQAAGDRGAIAKAQEALDARKAWLRALGV